MRRWYATARAISLPAMAGLLLASVLAHAGIRVDGTEFQTTSDVVGQASKTSASDLSAIVFTLSQPIIAQGELPGSESASKIGLGYEYNTAQTTDFGCTCNNQGDGDGDGFITALDLAGIIDALFSGADNPQDAYCPTYRFDFDCDDFTTALDLAALIDHVFASGSGPCDPCTP